MLAIATYATKSYLFAWPQFLRRISAAASHHEEAHFIFATDKSKEAKEAVEIARHELPEGWKISTINIDFDDSKDEKYKTKSQLNLAMLQGAAFTFARRIRAKMLWSVESDTLVPPDALKMSEWVLKMPMADGSSYYDIAACTYQNGLFLGGTGSPNHAINEDFTMEERKVPDRLKKLYESCKNRIKDINESILKERKEKNNKSKKFYEDTDSKLKKEHERLSRINDKIKECPPDGNIWEVIAKHGWRRRGWMDYAYPGIGKGAIVPSDWCGLGCTLMSEKALSLATFDGYDGRGTQDLFLCWNRWYLEGLRIACVPHVACDHVKIDKETKKIIHFRAYHETEGEHRNHLRSKAQDWIPI